jgi:hypothetical protein
VTRLTASFATAPAARSYAKERPGIPVASKMAAIVVSPWRKYALPSP